MTTDIYWFLLVHDDFLLFEIMSQMGLEKKAHAQQSGRIFLYLETKAVVLE